MVILANYNVVMHQSANNKRITAVPLGAIADRSLYGKTLTNAAGVWSSVKERCRYPVRIYHANELIRS